MSAIPNTAIEPLPFAASVKEPPITLKTQIPRINSNSSTIAPNRVKVMAACGVALLALITAVSLLFIPGAPLAAFGLVMLSTTTGFIGTVAGFSILGLTSLIIGGIALQRALKDKEVPSSEEDTFQSRNYSNDETTRLIQDTQSKLIKFTKSVLNSQLSFIEDLDTRRPNVTQNKHCEIIKLLRNLKNISKELTLTNEQKNQLNIIARDFKKSLKRQNLLNLNKNYYSIQKAFNLLKSEEDISKTLDKLYNEIDPASENQLTLEEISATISVNQNCSHKFLTDFKSSITDTTTTVNPTFQIIPSFILKNNEEILQQIRPLIAKYLYLNVLCCKNTQKLTFAVKNNILKILSSKKETERYIRITFETLDECSNRLINLNSYLQKNIKNIDDYCLYFFLPPKSLLGLIKNLIENDGNVEWPEVTF